MQANLLCNKEIRNCIINTQFPETGSDSGCSPTDVIELVDHLGYIQIDTLAVVNRTHHLVPWTRCNNYSKQLLHDFQSKDRSVFEYWGHAMAYLPMTDFRFYLPRMKNFLNPSSPWAKQQLAKCKDLLEPVKKRIKAEGPLGARDFKGEENRTGNWWNWKPAKVALELLFWQGELMISQRRNFQKVYDLTERVLPGHIDTTIPSAEECIRFIIKRGLQSMAFATENELFKFLQPGNSRDSDVQVAGKIEFREQLMQLEVAGTISKTELPGQDKGPFYYLESLYFNTREPKGVRILSPFDNFIIQRDRIKRLFGFDYALECYLPETKRIYGYYVMPILWKNQFIGRLDPKADRKSGVLEIKNLVFESGVEITEDFLEAFESQLKAFALFNDCDSIVFKKVQPRSLFSRIIKISL